MLQHIPTQNTLRLSQTRSETNTFKVLTNEHNDMLNKYNELTIPMTTLTILQSMIVDGDNR